MVYHSGLRIERLLYSGFFLVLLGFLEIYFVESASQLAKVQTQSLELLIDKVGESEERLQIEFEKQNAPTVNHSERDANVQKMRQKLGLGPEVKAPSADNSNSYKASLEQLIVSIPELSTNTALANELLNYKKPPKEILLDLKSYRDTHIKKSTTVFGVETPSILSFQYGATDVKIPPRNLSLALLMVLEPLAMIWLGSFYITRRRELLQIRAASDFKKTFPHILNWFPIDFSGLESQLGITASNKQRRLNISLGAFFTTGFRCFIILAISLLVIAPQAYSLFYALIELNPSMLFNFVALTLLFINAMLLLLLLVVEAITLVGKRFYE